jgi:RNA recognition motif-containing protein
MPGDVPVFAPSGESDFRVYHNSMDLSRETLRLHFAKFGKVLDVYVPRDPQTGQPRSYGFTTFHDEEGMEKALAHAATHDITGVKVPVSYAGRKPRQPDGGGGGGDGDGRGSHGSAPSSSTGAAERERKGAGPRVYVGGIDNAYPGHSVDGIKAHFGKHGVVTDVYVPKHRITGEKQVRSIHWSPYDPVRVVNAVP